MIKYLEDFSRNKNTWWASCVQPVLAPAQYIYIYIYYIWELECCSKPKFLRFHD